ncbi:4633_t:CDS:2, partial [Scutellospora calospora]
ILSEHENDLKSKIKEILCDRDFYENCRLIASVLYPLKIYIGCLESKTSNLADSAGQIWKNMGHDQESCSKLLSQIRKYKSKKILFEQLYNSKLDTPIIWWETAQYKKEEWELQVLALRLFAITPHSASCEQVMCKLHTFYITNAKQELSCYAIDIPENLLRNQLIESVIAINNETDEITDYDADNISTEINNETNEIINFDTSRVNILNIMNDIDIGLPMFNVD